MNGIINVYKERGFTSHDVVAKLRGILHMKKIGHTGTLDPEAAGVLPVCVGQATKVCSLLTDTDKTYVAAVKLGLTTDTQDMTGKILTRNPVRTTEADIRNVLSGFVGEIWQIPPMYSAIKVNGKKLYELARQGKEVERKPRQITIHELRLQKIELAEQQFTIEVTCSKGTYIRTLCQDIGEKLGCGAAMKSLVRTRSGRFALENALTLEEIEAYRKAGQTDCFLMPIDSVFEKFAKCTVREEGMRFLQNGNQIQPLLCSYAAPETGETVRMYDSFGEFYALYRYEEQDGMYHIVKMFHESRKEIR